MEDTNEKEVISCVILDLILCSPANLKNIRHTLVSKNITVFYISILFLFLSEKSKISIYPISKYQLMKCNMMIQVDDIHSILNSVQKCSFKEF